MPAQTEHHVGGTKHFECRVGGFPRPQIRWYKDGREITDSSRYQFDHSNDGVISMVIQNITHEDEGHYRCRAENSEGLASTSAYLLVKAHKELPDEPITSVHSMQFEETIVYTEKYKKAREIRKKIEALDNENSYEENYVIRSKEKRQREEEEEELTWKSLEAVISAQRTSSQLISPSPSSGTQRKEKSDSSETQRKEEAEEEESKISKDMLEKCYHSSDDDQDSVRLMTISERSEPISLQESLKDFEEEEEKSLLMRQTARLFSHELDEDEDFFKRDSAYQAVLTEMVGEHVMQELLQQEEQASKIAEWQVKSEIERVTKTEVQNSASKTDENGLLTAVKDLTKLVVSEERVVKLEAETKLASGDENNSLLPTPKQIENVDIERKRALADKPESLKKLKKDEADTVKSATSENVKLETAENVKLETVENVKSTTSEHVKRETAENVKSTPENVKLEIPENVKSVTPENVTSATLENGKLAASENVEKNVRDDVFQEEENQTHSVLTQKLIEVTEGKLSYDDVDLQVAGVEISDDSKVDSTDLPNEPIQQIIERETDFKLEDDDEETVSDSETEGSVGSVVGVNVTPASSLQKKEIEESNIDSDKTVFSQNLNETELSQTRFGEEKQKAIEDYPIIQPADDGSEVDGSTVEVVEPSTSWVQKVAQDKPQPEKTEDATAIGGDKEPVAKPVIKQVMEDIKIEAGKTLRLRTQVQAVPRAEVTWSKEGEVIIAGKRITVVTEDDVYTLEIENVGEEDAGRYRMTAINSAGSVYSEVLVSIVGQRQLSPALSPSLPVGHPRFVMRPQNVTVAEFESIKLSCSVQGDPMPKVSWEKDGERLRTSKRLRLYETRGIFYLEIPEADAEDAGEYVCTAVNSEGTVTASVTVSMQDMENVVQISCDPEGTVELTEGATGGAVESSSDEMFLKPFLVLMDYTDPDSKSGLRVGEFVEVLDSKQKSGMWLVRGMVDKEKVLFAPSYLLCASGRNGVFEEKKKEEDTDEELATVKRRDKKLTHSPKYGSIDGDNDTSEDEFRLRGVYPDYVAVADYNPSDGEKNSIRLSEGQIVEIIDKERSDLWLVQTRPTKTCPSRQGWVPSAYLEEKSVSAQFMRRSRETFREEVLQVKNKQQEAGLKRRPYVIASSEENLFDYVLKELEETEREYIRDLKTLIDNYVQPVASMTENLPDLLQAGADLIFSNISTIYKFHEGPFLQDLIGCCANPSSIGPTFLRWESEFYNYIKYWSDREAAGFILESVDIKSFFKELSKKQAVPGEAIFSLLNRPIERLKMYQLLLKDILRFSARAGDDCSQVEAAIAMLISIEKEVGNAKLIPLLEGCDFELTELGHLIRHDDLCVWEGDVSSTRVKDRHVFLFSEKIAMTKKKKPENSSDKAGFTYRTSMDLANVRLKENVPEDDRRFELWFIGDASVEKVTFQARSMFSKLAWVKDIRDALTKIGVIHPDHQSSEKDDEGKATPKASPQASPPRQQTSEAVPMKDQTSGKQKEQAGVTNGAKLTNSDLDLNDSDDVSSYYTAPEPDSGSEHVRPSLGHKQHRVICTEGSHTQLDCFVGKVSTSEVSWTKDRQPIQEGNGLSIKHQGDISSLVFSKAKASNSGKYTVTVVTSKGKHSTNFDLAVVDEFIETDTSTHKSEDGTDSESDTATEETQAGVDRSNRGGEKGLIVISQYEDHQTTVETAFTSQQFIESFVGEVSITAEEKEKELKAKEEEERLQQLKAKEEEERLQQLKAKEEEERLQQLKAKEEEERLQQLKAKEEEERLQQLKAKEEEERLQQLKAKEEEERLQQLKAKEEEERLQQLKAKEEEERLQQLKAKEEEERLQQLKAKEEEERLQQLKAKEEEERLQQLKAKEEEERLQQLKAKEEEERLQQLKAKEEEERLQQLKAKEEEERLQQLKAKEEEERLQQLKAKEEEERLQQLKAKEAEERLQQLKAKEEEERLQQLKAKEEEERLQQLKAKEEEERLQQLKAKEEEERLQQLKAKEEEERLQQLKAKEEEERLQQLKAKEEEERLQQLIAKEEEERLQQLKAKEEEERLQQLKAKEEEERLQQLKAKEEEQRLQQLKAKEEEERLQQLKAKEEEERLQQLKAKEEEERLQQLIAKEEEERLQQLKAKEEEERLQQLKAKEEEERLQQLKAKEEEERLQQLKAKEEEERLQQLKAKEEEERLQQLIAKEEEERLQQLKAKEEEERLQQLKAKEEEERLQQLKAKEEEERLQQLKAKEEEERLQQLKAKEEEERLHELKVKEEELQKLRAREEEILKEERLKAEKEDLLLHFETSLNETALEPLSDNTSSQSKLEFDSSLGDSNLFSHPSLTSLDSTLSSSLHIEEKSVQDFETSLEESQTGSYFKLTSAESSWSTHEHSGENIVLEFNSTVEQSKSSSHFEVTSTESSSETFENAEKPVLESDSTVEQSRTTSHIEVTLTESSFEKPVLEFDTTVDQSRSSHFEITSTESSFEKPVLESDSTVEQSRTSSQLEVTSTESSFERPVVEFDTTVKQSRTTSHIEVTSTESSFEKPVLEFDTTVDQSRSSHFEITSTESSFEKPVLEFDSAVEQSRTASHIEVTSTESSFEKPVLEFDTTVDQSRSSHFEITSTESSFDKPVLEFDSAVEQSRTASHIEVTSTESSFEKPVLEFDTTVDQSRSSHFENTSTESSFEKPVFESDSAVEQSRTTSHIEVTSTENSFEKPVLEFDSAVEQSKTSSKFEVTSIQSSSETSGNSVEQPVLKFDSTVEQSKSVSGLEVTSTESNSETSENSVEQPVLQSDSTVEQNRTTLQFEVTSIESSSENTSEKPVLEFDSNLYQSKTPLQFEVTSTESTSDTSVEQPVLEFESSVQEQHSTEESDSFRLDSSNNSSEVITFDLASSKQQLNKFDSDISVSASQQQRLSDLSPETPQQQRDLALEKPNQVEGTTQSSLAVEGRQATSQGKPFCAPQVTSKMDDCVIELGEMARFDCRVSAYPDPEITWFKDGNKVIPSAKFELVSFHDDIFSLLIKKVDTEDSGRYTCMAKNEYGEAKSEALLNVLDQKEKITDAHVAPCFLTKFYDIEAMEGVPVEFVCVIYGNPEPTVTWLLNGKEVEISSEILTRRQEDSVMMAFRSVQVCHSGEIICKLKNDSGEAMCKARLKVKEDISKRGNRPLFLEQPSDKEVSEGEEVTFECTISGLPDPDVTWYFNGRELYESRRRTMKRKGGQKYILTLREVVPENAGVYTCKAVNRAGDASCAVELSVKELPTEQTYRGVGLEADTSKFSFPPAFTRRIQDTMTAPGRMVRFEAMVIGVPEPEIEWVKDGFPLKAGSKYKMGREGHTSILVVENCDSIDDGTYTCNVYNDAGKASCSAQLRVQEERMRPSVPRFYSPSVARESYTESPTPSRRLVAREIPLEEKIPSMPIDKPICLDIKPNSVKLSWMPAPIGSLPENAQRITYTIEARELPNSSWVRLEGNIETTNHYIHNLKPDKEYMFRVRADNRYGTSETTLPCTLKAREEPARRESVMRETETPVRPVLPKTRPYISDIGKETIQLGWKPAELPYTGRSMSMPPVSYRVEAQKLPSEEWVPLASRVRKPSLYLSDLEPDRDYNIRVRAQTPYGVSQPTEPLWIPRAKAFTGVPVTRPTISEIEEGTARLQWNRVDIPAFDNMEQPLLYMIEMQEPPSYRWRELARRVPTNSYIVRDLEPAQDYRFRVRAESLDGLLSEPSPATSVFRTLALTHTPVDRLQVEEYDGDLNSARLSWRRVEVPPYGNSDSPLLYMIEYETPQMEGWRPLASGIPTTRYHVPDISPTDDYRFRVRALSPYGVSPPSYPTGLYRQMSPLRPLPQDLHISDLEPSSVRLSWRSASVPPVRAGEPLSYQIEALEYPKTEWKPLATNIHDTSYRLGGLKPSTDYSFRVRALTPSGLAEAAPPVTLTSLPVRPRFPVREPTITDLGSDSIRIQWKPAELPYYSRHKTLISYSVEYQEVPNRDWVTATRGIPDTSYTLRGLRSDRDYRLRVCPETEYGAGEYSLPVHAHRRTVPLLPTREPTLSNISPSSATLSWPPASLLSGTPSRPILYRVEGREPPSSTWYDVASRVPSTSYNLQFLYPDQSYMFRVFADYDGVESEPTLAVYLPCRAGPPKMPREAPYVSSVQPESLILSWRSVELPTRITDYSPVTYKIEVQEHPSSEWRPLERKIPQTHFHIIKLRPDQDYSFRVRAENEYGVSDPTDAVLVRKRSVPPALSPHEPMLSDVRPDSVRLTWRPAEVPSYLTDTVPVTYTILMQEGGDPNWQPIARRVAGTSYYVTGLSPDCDYNFKIQAENNFGTSLPSLPSRLHRQTKAPIYSPEIEDVEPSALRLSWRQPSVANKSKATYSVEMLEPSTWKWRPLVSRLPHPSYKVSNIEPTKDYLFRVRAEVDSVITEPSFPISYSNRRELTKPVAKTKALPTVPVERPTLSDVYDDSVRVNWHPTSYHGANRKNLPQAYRLEVRELPGSYWRTLVPYTDQSSYEVTDLRPNQDYAFRVRTVTDTGMSEPSLPVYHYRQAATPKFPLPSPEIADIGDDYISLGWKLVDIPAFDVDETPLSFMIEAQKLPDYDWRPVARGVTGMSHKVTGLEPRQDYNFRLRGETPVGVTQPSLPTSLYRRPLVSGVPIANMSVDRDSTQPYAAQLRWSPAYIQPYKTTRDLKYQIEVQEPHHSDWSLVARDIPTTTYTVPELSPRKDYLFRIKAQLPTGSLSAPTTPIPFYRLSAAPSPQPALTFPTEDYSSINRPYIESLILKVPPRMSIEKPEMTVISPDTVRLNWKSARVPAATANISPTTYRVEVRHEDSFEWMERATRIPGLTTDIKGLNPHIDYAFRVRAVNDFGWSESTLPVFLHRPQAPPKMPIDTPRMGLVQGTTMRLSWTPARIPLYARKTPITYLIEKKEPHDQDWVMIASQLDDTAHTIPNIKPEQDYLFRVRAENEFGISEATLPAALTRSKTPHFIRSSASRERELDIGGNKWSSTYSYIDSVSSGVPPRVPAGRPTISNVTETTLTLSWPPGRMPSYMKGQVKISYIVEAREPPNHLWNKLDNNVPTTTFKVTGLRPDQDYMFRVRAFNDAGMSEPTLPVTLTRERVQEVEPRTRRRSSVERFSSVERLSSVDRFASRERSLSTERSVSIPRVLSREGSKLLDDDVAQDTTPTSPEFVEPAKVHHGIDSRPVQLSLQLIGYPLPTVQWYFNNKKIVFGDKYDGYVTPSGLAVLEFSPMTWDDAGEYKCVAENESGESSFVIHLQLSDPPTFLEPIQDLMLASHVNGKLTCRVDGIPKPSVKFLKDWKPLSETPRYKLSEAGDQWSLELDGALPSDSGCYICVAENPAGKVFCTARLSVDGDIPAATIYFKKSNFEDDYYILEELGRGHHSVVRRVIERLTGNEFAAKFTHVRGEPEKDFFRQELDTLSRQKSNRVVRLHDAYESQNSLILVEEIVKGGNLLDRVCQDNEWSENKTSNIIKSVLQTLQDVHSTHVVHLDIEPNNLRFKSQDNNSLCLIDFGFARKLPLSSEITFNYGTPEFCSPEAIKNEAVSPATDVWSVGVLAHLLLTGTTPFSASTVPDVLSKTQECNLNLDPSLFSGISSAAQDFIARILVKDAQSRLSVSACLGHEWLKTSGQPSDQKLDIARLRSFRDRYIAQGNLTQGRALANLRSLKRLSEGVIIQEGLEPSEDPETGKIVYPDTSDYGQYLDKETWYEWQFRHQHGPDADKSSDDPSRPWRQKKDKELLDEEVKASYKGKLLDLDPAEIRPSLEKELEWLEESKKQDAQEPDEASLSSKRSSVASLSTEGTCGALFIEKLHDMAFSINDNVRLVCKLSLATSPTVVWYRNEELLPDGGRYKIVLEEDGEASLTIKSAKPYDAGVYKCVGRTKAGRVSCKMRLELGDVPGRPGQPAIGQISSTEALVIWEAPVSTGHSDILFYKVDYRSPGDERWTTCVYTNQEAAVVNNLKPETKYRFRVSVTNRFGASAYSWASAESLTKPKDSPSLTKDDHFDLSKLLAKQTATQPLLPSEFEEPPQEEEPEAVIVNASPDSVYNIGELLYKGKFYEDKSLTLPSDENKLFILRTLQQKRGQSEFDILKSLRHERVARLHKAFQSGNELHFVLDYNEGEHIARYLSQRRKYTEKMVVCVVRQVLHGLEYLQRSSLLHLNLQPASIVVSKIEGFVIQLTDFSLATKLTNPVGELVPRRGYPDFIAPEVVIQDLSGYPADVWGVGVLSFLLLSGVSPYEGKTPEETLVNIALNRYDAADLFENVTAEGLKFLFKVLKRTPGNRMTVQECLDHKWLQLADKHIKERENTVFLSNALSTFVREYDTRRQCQDFKMDFDDAVLPIQMAKRS